MSLHQQLRLCVIFTVADLNNCAGCHDKRPCIAEDIKALFATGFDGTKVDGCGPLDDTAANTIDLWYSALESEGEGRPFILEQCDTKQPMANLTWCPFHTYRTSNDIAPTFTSVVWNIQ